MSMKSPRAELIADIYDAAIDEARWPDFSRIVGRAAGIEDVAVWVMEDGRITDFSIVDTWRALEAPYKAYFSKIDPWAGSIARAPLETVMLGYEHMREDELIRTEFYNDFARPGGMFRPMGVRMRLAPKTFATMGSDLPWGKARFEQHDKPRMESVIPHVKSALRLRLRQRGNRPLAGTQAALDALAFGVVICDTAGRVAFANAAAEALARDGAGIVLTARDKPLAAFVPSEARALAALVADAGRGGAGGVLRLTGRDGATGLIVLVTPLPRGVHGERGPGYAMVALRPAWDSPAFTETMLTALFGLSPRQAAIALALYNGMSPERIAAERGIRITTLRTHLGEIFARTGAETQRDLVRLLGTLPPLRRS